MSYDGSLKHLCCSIIERCRRLHGESMVLETRPFNINSDWKLHQCHVYRGTEWATRQEVEEATHLTGLSVWLELRRNTGDYAEPERYPWEFNVEDGGSHSVVSDAVMFLSTAVALQALPGAIVVDVQSDDPQNLEIYQSLADWLAHVERVLLLWHEREDLVRINVLRPEGGVVWPPP